MPLKHAAHDGNSLLTFNNALTIFQAAERKAELLHVLPQTLQSVSVDLSGVDEIDTAGVQLLLLLKREVQRQDKHLQVAAMSPAVMAAFDLLQLHRTFETSSDALSAAASVSEGAA